MKFEGYMVGFYEDVAGETLPVFEHPCNTPCGLDQAEEFRIALNKLGADRYQTFKVLIEEVEDLAPSA